MQQLGDDRDQERSGLAGTGLGAADGVFAREGEAQHLCLDRRAIREAQVLDGVHQFRGEFEIVEAGLAFLGFDDEVFEFPWDDRCLGLGFAARFGGFRRVAARLLRGCDRRRLGVFYGLRLVLGCSRGGGPFRLIAVGAVAGSVRRSAGDWRELLSLAFTEHFLECFEHGHLINWLRNVRRAV
ncbi:hypothetical protein D9M71_477690 [compost metagenome]